MFSIYLYLSILALVDMGVQLIGKTLVLSCKINSNIINITGIGQIVHRL